MDQKWPQGRERRNDSMMPRIDKGTIEYTLTVGKSIHRETHRECVRFCFETTEFFTHFQYRLSIDVEQSEQELRFNLLGLRTGGFTMPKAGKAEYEHDFFGLKGDYRVRVVKQGSTENEFLLRITPKTVRIVEEIRHPSPFIRIGTV